MSDQRRAQVRELCDVALSAHDAHLEAELAVERAKQHAEECRVRAVKTVSELRAYIGQTVVVHRGQLVATPVGVGHLVVKAVESVEVLDAGLPGPVGESSVADELVSGFAELPEQLDRGEEPKVLSPVPGKAKKGKAKGVSSNEGGA